MIGELNKWLGDWQYIWFFAILFAGLLVEFHSNYMLRKEYDYDKAKDDKRKRTRTTKKTTSKPGGETVTEEQTETSEPVEEKHERHEPKV